MVTDPLENLLVAAESLSTALLQVLIRHPSQVCLYMSKCVEQVKWFSIV